MNLRRRDRVLVIGHRGAPLLAAPNSLAAFAAAVAAGADMVELDVGAGLLVGHAGEEHLTPPLRLEQALASLAGHEIDVQVDLKRIGIEAEVAAAVRASGLEGRVAVSSTWPRSLRALEREAPALTRIVGYPRDRLGAARLPWPGPLEAAGAAALRALMPGRASLLLAAGRAQGLALHHALCSRALVRAVQRRGAAVLAWTVNDPARIEALARLGVDGIVTDDPGMARSVLGTLSRP